MLAGGEVRGVGLPDPLSAGPPLGASADGSGGVQVDVMDVRDAARDLGPEWDDFRERAGIRSPFLRPDYMALWAETVGDPESSRVVTARRNGDLVGFAPFMVVRERFGPISVSALRFIGNNVGCPGDVMYSDIAAAPPRAPIVRALLAHAGRWRASRWDLGYLPPESDTGAIARAVLGADTEGPGNDRQPYVSRSLPTDRDAFLEGLSGEVRRNFRRRLRRLSEVGPVDVRVARSPAEVRATVAELIENHERWLAGTERGPWLGDGAAKTFLIEGAARFAAKDGYLGFALRMNGTPIAWNVGAFDGSTYFEQVASYDRTYRTCAPGVLLGTLVLQCLAERGGSRIELGPGFDERKRRLGASAVEFERAAGYRGWARSIATMYRRILRRPVAA